ncbi:MAG TPA: hypothetical protein VLN47_09490 [Clostridiaceae bacterium]|nr:hypothetical protein [Clostridiaceae bacterium]
MSGQILGENCKHCPEYGVSCEGNDSGCLCYRCPRNLGQCIMVKYCRETESILDLAEKLDSNVELMIEKYYRDKTIE